MIHTLFTSGSSHVKIIFFPKLRSEMITYENISNNWIWKIDEILVADAHIHMV